MKEASHNGLRLLLLKLITRLECLNNSEDQREYFELFVIEIEGGDG
ncbi:hypothetical protein N9064_00615 [bacterium]|nr:hypothetical protein [bacterium]